MVVEAFLPYTQWLFALHVIFIIAWMAGLFYLPRLFVYHCQVQPKSEESNRFKLMERRLYYFIMAPALVASLITGLCLALVPKLFDHHAWWWYCKLTAAGFLIAFHGYCGLWLRGFAYDCNKHSEKFYRVVNEIPTILMIIIVIMVIVQPF
ncbi:MAG: protoporphyrinogen oxidase HemJ [Acetobacter sp.]|nr:protoporphyrinogen oxidase HemJ [Acetobacter sp.]